MVRLIKNFLDIILLKKGPDIIPSSWLIFFFSTFLLALSSFGVILLIDNNIDQNPAVNLIAYAGGLIFYLFVIYIYGYSNRALQTLTAIIACGSLITIGFVFEYVFMAPFIGINFASFIAGLIMLWSIPVEGHIIACAINRKRIFGIMISISALFVQLLIQLQITSQG